MVLDAEILKQKNVTKKYLKKYMYYKKILDITTKKILQKKYSILHLKRYYKKKYLYYKKKYLYYNKKYFRCKIGLSRKFFWIFLTSDPLGVILCEKSIARIEKFWKNFSGVKKLKKMRQN